MATATGTYATTADLKTRLGITDTTDDTLLGTICDQVNALVEGITGRILAPIASTAYTFDGSDAIWGGRCLQVGDIGVRAITLLEVAAYTGASFVTMPASDYFIRPLAQERSSGWPGTEIWITDIPTAANSYPYFPPGFGTVRVTATWGWAAMPDEIIDLALTTAVRTWTGRQAGQADIIGTDEFGKPIVSRYLSGRDRATLQRYAEKAVLVI